MAGKKGAPMGNDNAKGGGRGAKIGRGVIRGAAFAGKAVVKHAPSVISATGRGLGHVANATGRVAMGTAKIAGGAAVVGIAGAAVLNQIDKDSTGITGVMNGRGFNRSAFPSRQSEDDAQMEAASKMMKRIEAETQRQLDNGTFTTESAIRTGAHEAKQLSKEFERNGWLK
jgi:hypothetical protein